MSFNVQLEPETCEIKSQRIDLTGDREVGARRSKGWDKTGDVSLSKDICNRCRLRHPLETPDRASDTLQARRQLVAIVVIYFSKKRQTPVISTERSASFVIDPRQIDRKTDGERKKKPSDKYIKDEIDCIKIFK